jgi:hypothetical protein
MVKVVSIEKHTWSLPDLWKSVISDESEIYQSCYQDDCVVTPIIELHMSGKDDMIIDYSMYDCCYYHASPFERS